MSHGYDPTMSDTTKKIYGTLAHVKFRMREVLAKYKYEGTDPETDLIQIRWCFADPIADGRDPSEKECEDVRNQLVAFWLEEND